MCFHLTSLLDLLDNLLLLLDQMVQHLLNLHPSLLLDQWFRLNQWPLLHPHPLSTCNLVTCPACLLETPYSRYTCFHLTSPLDLLDNLVLLLDQMVQFLLNLHPSLLLDQWLHLNRLRQCLWRQSLLLHPHPLSTCNLVTCPACLLETPYSRYTYYHLTSPLDLLDNQVLLLDQMVQFLLNLHQSLLLDQWLHLNRLRQCLWRQSLLLHPHPLSTCNLVMFLAFLLETPYSLDMCYHWTSPLDLLDNLVLMLDQMLQFQLALLPSLPLRLLGLPHLLDPLDLPHLLDLLDLLDLSFLVDLE